MALFTSYCPPGVYTNVILNAQSSAAIGTARVPVIIGEGLQYFTFPNVELFRGSSAVQDDQAVNEDISDQITGFGRSFTTTYFPVVDGTGKGTVTNDPSKVQVVSVDSDGNQLPVTVISLVGATGAFATQEIIPAGTTLKLTYFFKRGDTLITDENLTYQIPTFASLALTPLVSPPTNSVTISTTVPGAVGNLVSLQFVAGTAVADAQAVLGAGTNAITINITKTVGTRTLQDLANLITAGIPTLDAGYLTASAIIGVASTSLATLANISSPPISGGGAYLLTGGTGPSSNQVFKVGMANTPITLMNSLDTSTGRNIVDGTNGGVITTNPANVQVEVNGVPVNVTAVDGAHGLITLTNPINVGGLYSSVAPTLTATYYTNTWQNTFDLLPASNVDSITQVGFGPNRSDFAQGTDFVLGVDSQGNGTIQWGASVTLATGADTAGDVPFTPSEVYASLVDDQVFLRPVATGVVNGKNTVFTLQDTPVDGSGLSRITDNPSLVNVYVGTDPLVALEAGPVTVARLVGATGTVTLYNPPQVGVNVYASYYRSKLSDHQYAISVVTPGYSGLGTYSIMDEMDNVLPLITLGATSVAAGGFATTGVVYPYGFQDAWAVPGAVDEIVTLTFNNDGSGVLVPAAQASLPLVQGSGTLTFTASMPGVAGNSVQIAINASSTNAVPVSVSGNLVTIYANWNGTQLTLAQIAAFFPSPETTSGGAILCVASGTTTGQAVTTAATSLTLGSNAITTPVTHSYTVTSSMGASGSHGTGYLNQTYVDASTGFRVTVINPADHVSYGVPTIPSSYAFAPADTLSYVVSKSAVRHTGNPGVAPCEANNWIAIPGLHSKVTSTFNSTAGDTVVASTFNMSGNNPNVGDFYYASFTTSKTAADYALKLYTRPSDAYAVYGQPSTINRVSLGIQFMALNGVQSFGVIQVPVQPNTNLAASSDYIAALQQLTKSLPGSNRKADVVTPLSNDPSVHQALSRQLITQAGPRYKGEAIGFVGYSQFTTANQARANARALKSNRMIAIGNAAAAVMITNPTTGVAVEYPVDGTFMAAALAGLNCNPSNDVATTLTLQNLAGFSRLLVTYDDPTMDFMAADGLTMLLNNNGAFQIRHYKTTDPSNDLTSEPTSTTIADYVAQQFRADLKQFIGRKLVDSLVTDIQIVCNARLTSLMNNVIINGYRNLSVIVNPNDPTEVDVQVTFKPIFSLLYASVTFTVVTSL